MFLYRWKLPLVLSIACFAISGCENPIDARLQQKLEEEDASTEQRMREITEKHAAELAKLEAKKKQNQGTAGDTSTGNDAPGSLLTDSPPTDTGSNQPKQTDVKPSSPPGDGKKRVRIRQGSPTAWRLLRFGLKEADVRKILGEPTSISRDTALVFWTYGHGQGAGKIALTHKGLLWGWDEPTP